MLCIECLEPITKLYSFSTHTLGCPNRQCSLYTTPSSIFFDIYGAPTYSVGNGGGYLFPEEAKNVSKNIQQLLVVFFPPGDIKGSITFWSPYLLNKDWVIKKYVE